MQNTGGGAVKRIFVKVFGFSDVERHALNTVFRLSESREVAYSLWTPEAPKKAQVALLDGDSWEANLELANPAHDVLKLIWVGDNPSPKAWKVCTRPLRWVTVIEAMDQLYAPAPAPAATALDFDLDAPPTQALDLDFDLDLSDSAASGNDVTAPMPLEAQDAGAPAKPAEGKKSLIIDSDRDARLYLRAKLAAAGLFNVDEAASAEEVRRLLRFELYGLVLLDLDLPDEPSWQLMKLISESKPSIEHIILTGTRLSKVDAVRGWFAGARATLPKPLDPARLLQLLKASVD